MNLKDVKNEQFKSAFKARRQMDRTQYSVGNEVVNEGALTHFRKQKLTTVLKDQRAVPFVAKQSIKPADSVMNTFDQVLNEEKEVQGKHIRKSKMLEEMSVLEVLKHDK